MESLLWLLWDGAALCILMSSVHRYAARGFLRTVVHFLGYIASAAVAGTLSPVAARLIYDNLVKDALHVMIEQRMGEALAGGAAVADALLEAIPESLMRIAVLTGSQILALPAGQETAGMIESAIEAALASPVLAILRTACFFLLFGILLFFVRRVGYLFGGVYRLPLIGAVNTVLGGVIGVLQALVMLYLLALLLQLVIVVTGGELSWLNYRIMDSTYILRVFFDFSLRP